MRGIKKRTLILIGVILFTFAFSGLYAYASILSGKKSTAEIFDLKWELVGDAKNPTIHLTWSAFTIGNLPDHLGSDFDNMLVEWEYNYETPPGEKDGDARKSRGWSIVSFNEKTGLAQFEFYRPHIVGTGPCRYKVHFPGYRSGAAETEWIYFKEANLENYFKTESEGKEADGKGDAVKNYRETADWPERLVSNILMALPKYLIGVLGLYDPIELAFGIDINSTKLQTVEGSDLKYEEEDVLYFDLFTESEMREAIGPLYDTFHNFVPMQLVIILSVVGLIYMFRSAYPDSKLTAREYLAGFLFALLMLKFGPFFLNLFAEINGMLVKLAMSVVLERNANAFNSGFIDSIYDPEASGLIGDAVIAFVAAFSVGVINWQYAMRKLTIAVLIAILPVTLVISIFPTRREAIGIWIKEMTANMFLQAAHALVIAFMILFLKANENHSGPGMISQTFIMQLAVVMGLTTISSLVRRVIGAESMGHGTMGLIGAGLGFAGISAVGRILSNGGSRRVTSAESSESESGSSGSGGSNNGVKAPVPAPKDFGKRMDLFARRGVGIAGSVAGKVAGTTVRAGIAGAGALTGAMIGGALTGKDSIGAAGGALIADKFGGRQIGSLAGNQVKGMVEGAGNFGLYGMKAAFGELGGVDGIDKANKDLGMSSEGIKYNPELAKEAGTNILGNNLPGKVLGAGLGAAASYRLTKNPDLAADVKNLNRSMAENRSRIAEIQQTELPTAQTRLETAKMRYSEAKNLYSPNCEAMKKLDPNSPEYQENIQKYSSAKANLENHEAAYARLQSEQAQLSRSIEQQAVYEEMNKLVEKNQNWSGGHLGTEWKQ